MFGCAISNGRAPKSQANIALVQEAMRLFEGPPHEAMDYPNGATKSESHHSVPYKNPMSSRFHWARLPTHPLFRRPVVATRHRPSRPGWRSFGRPLGHRRKENASTRVRTPWQAERGRRRGRFAWGVNFRPRHMGVSETLTPKAHEVKVGRKDMCF